MTRRNLHSGQASVVLIGALVICLGFTGLAVDGARLFIQVIDGGAVAGVGHGAGSPGAWAREKT